jgi:hypothetical protein
MMMMMVTLMMTITVKAAPERSSHRAAIMRSRSATSVTRAYRAAE